MKKIVFLVFIAWVFLSACQSSKITTGELAVTDAWARPAKTGDNGAVYFAIENGTSQADVLLAADTDIASAVELHLSQMEDDHMSMHQQAEVALPAGEAVAFSPGGFHIMLVGLTRDLRTGETFDLLLMFENAGEKSVTVTVKDDVNDD
jgi:periplasmic copper chaperone A